MSGNVFVCDHILMDVCPDAARRQLERLARDGVLLRASEHAGARLEAGIVRCFAAVTIDGFIARLACALMHPAGSAIPAGRDGQNSVPRARRETS